MIYLQLCEPTQKFMHPKYHSGLSIIILEQFFLLFVLFVSLPLQTVFSFSQKFKIRY